MSITVCYHAKQTQLIIYNYNNNNANHHVIVYIFYWLGSWDSNMPWRIFMVCAHKEKKRTDKLESQKDLILNSTIIVQNLPPSDLELFIRNTNTNFIHHKKLLIFINSSWVNKEREWKCFSTVYLPWVVFLLSGKSEMEEKYICGFFPKTSFLLCLQEDLERSFLAYANYKIGFLTKEWRPEILERV